MTVVLAFYWPSGEISVNLFPGKTSERNVRFILAEGVVDTLM
jgi:hypothetical protein